MNWLKKYWKWIALALVLIALSTAAAFLPVKDWVKAFSEWVRTLGALGVVVFIGVYALATVLFLPEKRSIRRSANKAGRSSFCFG